VYSAGIEMNVITYDSVHQKVLLIDELWLKIHDLNIDLSNQTPPSISKKL
jgi:hypothetical protein